MSNNSIEMSKSFNDRMKERVKESIGELLTDEELSSIVKKGVNDLFFEPIYEKNSWGSSIKVSNPLAVVMLEGLLEEKVKEEVKNYISNNKEDIHKEINKIIENGIFGAVVNTFTNMFKNDFYTFQSQILTTLNNNNIR